MKISDNIHQIDVPFFGRIASVYLLMGKRPLLIDSGVSTSPDEVILPALKEIGVDPGDLWGLVCTHAHADHCGGNAILKEVNPNMKIMSLDVERMDIENPMLPVCEFYNPYREILGVEATEAGKAWNKDNLGSAMKVNHIFQDGDTLDLGGGWILKIHHTPGHTKGHLSIFDEENKAAFIGDAVLWKGLLMEDKFITFPPYLDVDSYLDTIHKIRGWSLNYLCTSHYSTLTGDRIKSFLDESEEFVLNLDSILKDVIGKIGTSVRLEKIARKVLDHIGGDYLLDACALSTIDCHMKRLLGSEG